MTLVLQARRPGYGCWRSLGLHWGLAKKLFEHLCLKQPFETCFLIFLFTKKKRLKLSMVKQCVIMLEHCFCHKTERDPVVCKHHAAYP